MLNFVIVNAYVIIFVNVYMCMNSVLYLQMSDFLKFRFLCNFWKKLCPTA
jgi:hypothetical protein